MLQNTAQAQVHQVQNCINTALANLHSLLMFFITR